MTVSNGAIAEPKHGLDITLTFRRSDAAISCELSDDMVILNLATGTYFGLDPVASRIWQLLEKPSSIQDIRDQLMREYDVDASQCEESVGRFIRQLSSKQLVEAA